MSKKVSEQKDEKMTATKKIVGIAAAAGSVGLLAAGTIAAKLLRLRKAKAEEENVELLETKDEADAAEEEAEDSIGGETEIIIEAGVMDDAEESEEAEEAPEEEEPETPAAEADDAEEEKADDAEPAQAEAEETKAEADAEAEEAAAEDSETAEA